MHVCLLRVRPALTEGGNGTILMGEIIEAIHFLNIDGVLRTPYGAHTDLSFPKVVVQKFCWIPRWSRFGRPHEVEALARVTS